MMITRLFAAKQTVAEAQLLQAIRIAQQVGNTKGERICLHNLANCYMAQGAPAQALAVLNQAIAILHGQDPQDAGQGLCDTLFSMATLRYAN
jgi:ATP/maltotriose-dependent transcriptional regulator MalT